MVAPLPSTGNTAQPTVRIDITDSDKQHVKASRIRKFPKFRFPYVVNAFLSIIVLSGIILLELGYIPATKIGFYCQDPSLSYKFNGDTVSATTLLVGNLLILPCVILCISEFLQKDSTIRICLREFWYFYKEFLIGCALVLLITEIIKALIGEHRPHFFDVCQPDSGKNCTKGQYVYSYECTLTKYTRYFMSDTSRSFPSGHSSLSFFVAIYFSFLVQMRVPTVKTGKLFKPFLISCCLTWALVCSLTRLTDKRHHWWDVLGGMMIGCFGAWYTLHIIYRRLNQNVIVVPPRLATSTTTLLDVKNKDAKSEII
ncbi:hypothetical protein ABEB36_003222 [Hypothenemus hampei]